MNAYCGEAFYEDMLIVDVFADEVSKQSFGLLYRITALRKEAKILIAEAKTGMLCFDYQSRWITTISESLKTFLLNAQNSA